MDAHPKVHVSLIPWWLIQQSSRVKGWICCGNGSSLVGLASKWGLIFGMVGTRVTICWIASFDQLLLTWLAPYTALVNSNLPQVHCNLWDMKDCLHFWRWGISSAGNFWHPFVSNNFASTCAGLRCQAIQQCFARESKPCQGASIHPGASNRFASTRQIGPKPIRLRSWDPDSWFAPPLRWCWQGFPQGFLRARSHEFTRIARTISTECSCIFGGLHLWFSSWMMAILFRQAEWWAPRKSWSSG